jgi:hypothetical protein
MHFFYYSRSSKLKATRASINKSVSLQARPAVLDSVHIKAPSTPIKNPKTKGQRAAKARNFLDINAALRLSLLAVNKPIRLPLQIKDNSQEYIAELGKNSDNEQPKAVRGLAKERKQD